METKIKTLKLAKELTLDVWEQMLVEIDFLEPDTDNDYNVTHLKGKILEDKGYEMKKNCPLCQWRWQKVGGKSFDCMTSECRGCPIFNCSENGYDDYMTKEQIETFVKFLREKLRPKPEKEKEA